MAGQSCRHNRPQSEGTSFRGTKRGRSSRTATTDHGNGKHGFALSQRPSRGTMLIFFFFLPHSCDPFTQEKTFKVQHSEALGIWAGIWSKSIGFGACLFVCCYHVLVSPILIVFDFFFFRLVLKKCRLCKRKWNWKCEKTGLVFAMCQKRESSFRRFHFGCGENENCEPVVVVLSTHGKWGLVTC